METEQKQENEKTEPTIVEAALAVAPPPVPAELLSLGRKPEEILEEAGRAAKALMGIVEANPKKVIINGEVYLEFEHWQTVGRFFGLTTGLEGDAEYIEFGAKKDKKFGFKAKAYLLSVATGQKISHAQSMCLSDEPKWKHKPLFQMASMSQTRAQAKAFRNVLSFVVVLAGYRPTPAEEMELNGSGSVVQMPQPSTKPNGVPVQVNPNNMVDALKASIQDAQKKKRQTKDANSVRVRSARTMDELREVYRSLNQEERQQLMPLINARRAELEVKVCQ